MVKRLTSSVSQAPLEALVASAIRGAICRRFRLHLLVAGTIAGAIEGTVFRRHLLVAGAVSQAPLEALFVGAVFLLFAVPFKVRFRHSFQALLKCHFRR